MRHLGPAITGMAFYFLPISGVILSAIFLGETLRLYHLAGTLLTIGGVVTATFRVRQATGT
ncbi:EamA-like transporter family protein [compost metagenome]